MLTGAHWTTARLGDCHPGDCCYKRIEVLRALMKQLGVEEARLRLEWIPVAEGVEFARVVRDYTEEIRKLGPLELRRVAIEDET